MSNDSSNFDPKRWMEIEQALDAWLDASPEERPRLLDELRARDSDLYGHLRTALDDLATETPTLNDPLWASAPRLLEGLQKELDLGAEEQVKARHVGSWRLSEQIGRGGMGVVYRGHRADGQYEQEVAVKLLPHGLDTPELHQSFLYERQILARLRHPSIASLLDGGVTEDGAPYFVLELVDGLPIDQFCTQNALGLEARLDLFVTVCEAVDHAHRSLVVHRDLKPANILVEKGDARTLGRVKLLDFGIAKVLDESEHGGTALRALTPQYAAPEQLESGGITTATDVYALGMLLYRLLAGGLPTPHHTGGRSDSPPAPRPLPPRPSELPLPQGSTPPVPRKALAGDLDTIVMTAIQLDPAERYASARELAEEVRRYLRGHPLAAHPPSVGYRTKKFLRRHRAGVALTLLAVGTASAGITAYVVQAREVQRQALKAARVGEFLSSLLAPANLASRKERSLAEILERAADRLHTELLDEPEVRAELLYRVGMGTLWLLNDPERARPLLEEALELAEARDPSSDQTRRFVGALALDARLLGDTQTLAELAQREWELAVTLHGEHSPEAGVALTRRARVPHYTGDAARAEALYRQAAELLEHHTDSRANLGIALSGVASTLEDQGRSAEALPFKERSLEIFIEAGGEADHDAMSVRNNLGFSYLRLLRLDEAQRSFEASLELARSSGLDGYRASPLTNLSFLARMRGRFGDALQHAEAAIADFEQYPLSNEVRLAAEMNRGAALLELDRVAEATTIFEAVVASLLAESENDRVLARARVQLADARGRAGRAPDAERLYRLALEEGAAEGPTTVGLARALVDQARPEDARPLLISWLATEGHGDLEFLVAWRRADAEAELARIDGARGDLEAQRVFHTSMVVLQEALPPDHWRIRRHVAGARDLGW